jgi:membrane protease YdiL (CAAX protease family)
MTTLSTPDALSPVVADGRHRLTRRHPVTVFITIALLTGWVLLTIPAVLGAPPEPFLLVTCYGGLMGTALVLTRWTGGPGAVKALLRRAVQVRIGLLRFVVILGAMPLLTLGVAAATGTLHSPAGGWTKLEITYLASVLVLGALLFNIPEEIGWSGFVQSRLMQRYGLRGGALRTAPFFVAIHIPLLFAPGWTWTSVGISFGALAVAAPFFRYLLGMHLLDTDGSLFAVGLQHAAFNGSGALAAVHGGWQYIPAMIVLTLLTAWVRHRRARARARAR